LGGAVQNIEIIYNKGVKVPYAENISGNLFDVQVQRAGLAALQELKAEAKTKGAQTFAGVATAAFRLRLSGWLSTLRSFSKK